MAPSLQGALRSERHRRRRNRCLERCAPCFSHFDVAHLTKGCFSKIVSIHLGAKIPLRLPSNRLQRGGQSLQATYVQQRVLRGVLCENLQAIDDGILAAAWASNGARSIRNGDRFLTSTSRWLPPAAAARHNRPDQWRPISDLDVSVAPPRGGREGRSPGPLAGRSREPKAHPEGRAPQGTAGSAASSRPHRLSQVLSGRNCSAAGVWRLCCRVCFRAIGRSVGATQGTSRRSHCWQCRFAPAASAESSP